MRAGAGSRESRARSSCQRQRFFRTCADRCVSAVPRVGVRVPLGARTQHELDPVAPSSWVENQTVVDRVAPTRPNGRRMDRNLRLRT